MEDPSTFSNKFDYLKQFFLFKDSTQKENGAHALRFSCVKCLPQSKILKSCTTAPLSNLRAHLMKVHGLHLKSFEELCGNSTPSKRKRHLTADDKTPDTKKTQPQLVEDQSAHSDLYDFEENDTQGSEVDEFLSCKNRTLTIFNNDSFPNVKRVFMKFNAPEASSARSERLFSGGKLIFETKRTSLGDANYEKLLILSVNKNLGILKSWCFDFFLKYL